MRLPKIKLKAKTTRFMTAYVGSLSAESRAKAKAALDIYTRIAGRPEFKDADLGHDFARTLAFGPAELERPFKLVQTYGETRGREIFAVVADFHDYLVTKSLLAANPYRKAD